MEEVSNVFSVIIFSLVPLGICSFIHLLFDVCEGHESARLTIIGTYMVLKLADCGCGHKFGLPVGSLQPQ